MQRNPLFAGQFATVRASRYAQWTIERRCNTVRARRRHEAMVGGVARSHAELDEIDIEFWERASPSERLEATWQLACDGAVDHWRAMF